MKKAFKEKLTLYLAASVLDSVNDKQRGIQKTIMKDAHKMLENRKLNRRK